MRHLWVTSCCFLRLQLRKAISVLGFSLALFFSLPAASAPPAPFDAWVNQGGRIVVPCPSGFTCDDNVVDTNILQRTLMDTNGRRFIHLILQDGAMSVDGQMILETYVDGSNANQAGASVRQSIVQNGAINMNYVAEFNTGWADSPGSPTVSFDQTLTDTTAEGVGFMQNFNLDQNLDANENITGYRFGIRQEVTNSAVLNGIAASGTDTHVFVLRRVGGDMLTSGGSASLPAAAGGMGMGGAGGGGGMGGAAAPAPAPAPAPVAPAPATGVVATPATPATPAPAPATGGGVMGMSARSSTFAFNAVPAQRTTASAPATVRTQLASADTSGLITTFGTTSGAGASPCPTDGPPPGTGNGRTTGTPPVCGTDPAPTDPGSTGTGTGGLAPAPAGTLAPGPRTGAPGGLVGNPAGMGMGGGPAGGSISWAAGDEIQVIWIGQVCQGCQTVGGMGGMGGGSGSFSFQAYENLTSGAPAIVTRSILQSNPFNWAAPFGPQP